MQGRWIHSLILLSAVFSTAACTEIKQGLDDASARLDRLFGVEAQDQAPNSEAAERLYRQGLAARERGAEQEAFAPLLEAAELGHAAAAYEVGLAYQGGHGTEQDLEASAEWINKAAERGEARAQYLIGAAYYTGTGVKHDYEHAVRLLADAALQGHASAQFLLGQAFANGNGVAKNRAWAARWYGKAAAQGLAEAQFTYGVVHASGLGLPKNRVRGYAWLRLAARQGHEKAEEVRQALAKKMTPDQIRRAEARAEGFRVEVDAPLADPPTVIYVQHALNGLGFDAGSVDGVTGKRTRGAITSYQKSRGLPVDGAVKPALLRRLLEEQTAGG